MILVLTKNELHPIMLVEGLKNNHPTAKPGDT